MDDAVAWPGDGSHCSCSSSPWPDAEPCPIRRRSRSPRRRPRPGSPSNQGELKAATWRAAAAAEARRLARLRAAIRRARKSTTVAGALRLARLTGRISPATEARLTATTTMLARAAARLTGARSSELWSVIGVVDSLAAAHLLDAGRLRPAFLVLHRNTEFWTHNAFPYASQRITFGRDPAVFQYYPGRGMQLQPLASWGKANWLAGQCLRARTKARRRAACPVAELRRTVDRLLELAAPRGDFLAWEHYFSWGGGTPPWISGMTQATAISALARASRALDEPRWRRAAHRALGAFTTPPPVGVDGGDHFLMYSFSPTLRVFNGELQAVNGIGELAAAYPSDRLAARLFRRGERTARAHDRGVGHRRLVAVLARGPRGHARLPPADRGLLRRHVLAHAAADLLRGARPVRTLRARADADRRSHRYGSCERAISRPCASRSPRSRPCRCGCGASNRLAFTRDLELPHGSHSVLWAPPRAWALPHADHGARPVRTARC